MNLKRIIYHVGRYGLSAWLAIQSLPLFLKARKVPDQRILTMPYRGQPILLLAMYEPHQLRPDIENLVKLAQSKGLYVIGINNAHLETPSHDHFNTYIERFNLGRDFGAYRCGFQYLFEQGWDNNCPRIIFLNDSVYYDASRLPTFLDALLNTSYEVCGATDNHEIVYHLGSFCISVAGTILRQPRFQAFWDHYALSEVRLINIRRGELGLSRCLKSCVSDPAAFGALYTLPRLEQTLRTYPQEVNTFMAMVRRAPRLSWPRLTGNPPIDEIIAYSKRRSPIHQNAAYLLHLGMPLIKLDGFFRGAFGTEDVAILCAQLPEHEANALKRLLYRRSYGGDTLYGWKKILFLWGFI